MKRYYFYAPSKYRKEQREKSVIDFDLAALYGETVYSTKNGANERRFSYFDVVEATVATKESNLFDFKVETGKDGCMGHWAKTEAELIEDKKKWGFKLVSEREYLLLRKLAIKLLFRHTQSFIERTEGENRFYWSNFNNSPFYDIKLVSLNYKFNTKNHDDKWLEYLKSTGLPLNDVTVPENFRIFVIKPRKGAKSNSNCTFQIRSIGVNPVYSTFEEAVKGLVTSRENTKEITSLQFQRIRKICRHIMFDSCDLDLAPVKKVQDYSVRVLDSW